MDSCKDCALSRLLVASTTNKISRISHSSSILSIRKLLHEMQFFLKLTLHIMERHYDEDLHACLVLHLDAQNLVWTEIFSLEIVICPLFANRLVATPNLQYALATKQTPVFVSAPLASNKLHIQNNLPSMATSFKQFLRLDNLIHGEPVTDDRLDLACSR